MAMPKIYTIPLHIGDLIQDTYMLSTLEFGAYMRLLIATYNLEGKLPNDDKLLKKITGLNGVNWAKIKPTIMQYFTQNGSVLTQKRVTETLFEILRRSEQARSNSLKRWETGDADAMQRQCDGNANAMLTINHKPKAINHKDIYSTPFLEFWKEYPRRGTENKTETYKEYKRAIKQTTHEKIMEGCKAYKNHKDVKAGYAQQAQRWLKRHGWEIEDSGECLGIEAFMRSKEKNKKDIDNV
jgi:uncharacterized protein YdaU (DUF1376 family)